jgi:hypothetical protein
LSSSFVFFPLSSVGIPETVSEMGGGDSIILYDEAEYTDNKYKVYFVDYEFERTAGSALVYARGTVLPDTEYEFLAAQEDIFGEIRMSPSVAGGE